MNIERVYGKIISTSQNQGTSLLRSGNMLVSAPINGIAGHPKSYDQISEPSGDVLYPFANTPYRASNTCGGHQGGGAGGGSKNIPDRQQSSSGSLASTRASTSTAPEEPEEPEEPICPGSALILAAPDGYYAISVDTEEIENSSIVYIGSKADSDCIIKSIGRIENINISKFKSNSQPSRWAFKEGVRIHCIPTEVNLYSGMPMVASVLLENFGTIGEGGDFHDRTFISHYGNPPGINTEIVFAHIGGCAVNGDVAFFSENSMLIGVDTTDFNFFDNAANDQPSYILGPRWIDGLEIKHSCPTDPVFTSGNPILRLTELLNQERYCKAIVQALEISYPASNVAQDYADKMAINGFLLHQDPYTGEYASDRMQNDGVEYSVVAEVLAQVPNPNILDPIQNLNNACDALWNAWKESPVHYDGLIRKDRFWIGWGVSQSPSDKSWYGCGLIFIKEGDKIADLNSLTLTFPKPPEIPNRLPPDHTEIGQVPPAFRAFCTAPKTDIWISCECRDLWEGYINIFGTDYYIRLASQAIYGLTYGPIKKDVLEDIQQIIPESAISAAPIETYPSATLGEGGYYRSNSKTVTFWVQRDTGALSSGNYNKSIYVKIEPHTGQSPPRDAEAIPSEDYFRTTPKLLPEEDEPNYTSTGDIGGKCSLWCGNTLIHDSHHYHSGPYKNRYQDIMVGSVFFTNSGFTAVTYTLNKPLNTEHRGWRGYEAGLNGDYQFEVDIDEYYYWFKQEFWAAVIGTSGNLIARWKLGAAPPEYSEDVKFYQLETVEKYIESSTQTYHTQFKGVIFKGSVVITCQVNKQVFTLIDNGLGSFNEAENQIEGFATIMSNTSISYTTGSIELTFGPERPDVYSTMLITAKVFDCEAYAPIEMWGEIAYYDGNWSYLQPYQLSWDGIHPLTPNLTITEDGRFAIFTCKTSGVTFLANPRLTYGDDLRITANNSFTNMYGSSKLQAVVFDLNAVTAIEPKRVSDPLFTKVNYGDTVVLN